jgi:hypothetical protein
LRDAAIAGRSKADVTTKADRKATKADSKTYQKQDDAGIKADTAISADATLRLPRLPATADVVTTADSRYRQRDVYR